MKKRRLQKTVLISYAIYALVMILCIGTVVVVQDVRTKNKEIKTTAFSFVKTAADLIDGDTIENYYQTGQTDEYYQQVRQMLQANLDNSDLVSFYVAIPRDNDVYFLWDTSKTESGYPLGTCENYDVYAEGAKEFLQQVYTQDPPEEIITGYENGTYIATACWPVYNSAGQPVAIVSADLSMPDVEKEITTNLLAVIFVVIGLEAVSALAFFITERQRIIVPIQKLNDASQQMVANLESESNLSIDISSKNEIGDLAKSFEKMYGEVKAYISRLSAVTAEKERIGAELDVAARIQASMLPCIFPPFPSRPEFDIYATMNPAKEVGGDFYDFFMVDAGHLAVVVADVSGKGVPAALFMVIGKTLIKDHTGFHDDLGEVFTEVNDILCSSNSEEMFITAFEGVLDIATGEFRYVNAGHETPFICRHNGIFTPFDVKPGFVLAGMANMRYTAGSLILQPGDKLFQYTDGVTEAAAADAQLYGLKRLEKVLAANSDKEPRPLLEAVKADVDAFVAEAAQFDDITMLCLQYKGGAEPMHEMTVDATLANIETITAFTNEQLDKLGCPAKIRDQFDVAIDEIVSNIARYAYTPDTGTVCVRVEVAQDPLAVIISFTDNGIPFDPLSEKEPDLTVPADQRPAGGLGIYLVRKSMDDIRYQHADGKNILTIKKNIESK